jgi:hypothetical protein
MPDWRSVRRSSKSRLSKWERGEKRPAGASLKLLNLVDRHGLRRDRLTHGGERDPRRITLRPHVGSCRKDNNPSWISSRLMRCIFSALVTN